MVGSLVLMTSVYSLSIAPNFTDDPYLKLLPVFLIPIIMIASSDATGFAMNVELMLAMGIISALYIKLLTMFDRTKKLLKEPREDKFFSVMLYLSILLVFMGFYYLIGSNLESIPLHAPLPQPKSAMYFLLVFLYLVITLASTTGFQIEFGGKKSKAKKEEDTGSEEAG